LSYRSCIKNSKCRKEYIKVLNKKTKKRITINGDTPILDMLIEFNPTFTDLGKPSQIFDSYSSVGIITGELKSLSKHPMITNEDNEDNELVISTRNTVKNEGLLIALKNITTNSHNSHIIPIDELYLKSFRLSEILNRISLYKIQNPHLRIPSKYILMSCRNYMPQKVNHNNYSPISTLHRTNYTNISYSHTYENFSLNILNKLKRSIISSLDGILFQTIRNNLIYLIKYKEIPAINFDLLFLYLIDGNVKRFFNDNRHIIERLNLKNIESVSFLNDKYYISNILINTNLDNL